MIDILRRWRTWIFNVLAALVLFLPDILQALAGFNWGSIVPPQYLPWVTLAIVIVNIWMRPRAAAIPSDPEVQARRRAREEANPWDWQ